MRGEKICKTSQKSNRRPRRTYCHCSRCHSHESAWVFAVLFHSREQRELPSLLQHRKLRGCATIIRDRGSPSSMQKRFKYHLPQGSTKKTAFIWEKVPNMGGWGDVAPNFFKSLFLWHISPLYQIKSSLL